MRPSLASEQHLHYNNLLDMLPRSKFEQAAILRKYGRDNPMPLFRRQKHIETDKILTELYHSSGFAHVPTLSVHWPGQVR
jgi:hypothetical protein